MNTDVFDKTRQIGFLPAFKRPCSLCLLAAFFSLLIGCSGHEEAEENQVNEQEIFDDTASDMPSRKQMYISKEGSRESIEAKLYKSPLNFPQAFSIYYPSELLVEETDSNGLTVEFIRNKAVLYLHFFQDTVKSKTKAMELAEKEIAKIGEYIETDKGFRLKPTAGRSAMIEVLEHNGQYYYWLSNYPVEYGDGFGAEVYFIKQQLEWQEQ